MHTIRIGDIGEAQAVKDFISAGWNISKPVSVNNKYDFIVESPSTSKLYKVQVKTTERLNNGAATFACRYSGLSKNKKWINAPYTSQDCDMMYLYCMEKDWSGIILSNDFPKSTLRIRFENPSHPDSKINRTEDYSFMSVIQDL